MEMNGMDGDGLKAYVEGVRHDPKQADRDPIVVAQWQGGSRSRVEMDGKKSLNIGGDDEFSAMAALLGMLAACDVEVVSVHATLIGLEIRDLRVEARGHFNVATLLGLDRAGDAAYEEISYKVVIDAPEASEEQIAYLRERCERSSPVGDSLRKQIPLALEFERR